MANRSIKRYIRQAKEDHVSERIPGESFQRAWDFNSTSYQALETQVVSVDAARSDQLINMSNYREMYETIEIFEEKLKINNKDIAVWVRSILLGEKLEDLKDHNGSLIGVAGNRGQIEDLKKFLVNFTYLLFGTEAVREPASFLMHQMALDLIISGNSTWYKMLADRKNETHFGGGLLPMTMGSYKVEPTEEQEAAQGKKKSKKKKSEPVKCVRRLQGCYGEYSPRFYRYPGPESTKKEPDSEKEFITRQLELLEEWIKWKNPQCNMEENPDVVIKALEDAVLEWFPSSVESHDITPTLRS